MPRPCSRRSTRTVSDATDSAARHGLARVLSRMGICSRSEAARRVAAGRVALNGTPALDPETPVDPQRDRIEVDGVALRARARVCIAVNKPRGLVTSAADERARDTVYTLLRDPDPPWLAPVGRLDKASEGMLLMCNDPAWAARITDPARHVAKTYRVQVRAVLDEVTLGKLRAGIVDREERLTAESIRMIGGGARNTWCEIVLREGRNRQIRRMLSACGCDVLRLIRIAIGPLQLGDLPKGGWRELTEVEMRDLSDVAS